MVVPKISYLIRFLQYKRKGTKVKTSYLSNTIKHENYGN